MRSNIERTFLGIQLFNDTQAWLVNGAFGFLSVLEGHADLVPKLRAFIVFESFFRLSEVILNQVKERVIVIFRDTRIFHDECTVGNQCFCCLDTKSVKR